MNNVSVATVVVSQYASSCAMCRILMFNDSDSSFAIRTSFDLKFMQKKISEKIYKELSNKENIE